MKQRAVTFYKEHHKLIGYFLSIAVFLIVYYLVMVFTPLRLPCILHELTGLYCPGCGLTRCCLALLQGDVMLAFRQNAAVLILTALWTVIGMIEFIFNPKWLDQTAVTAKVLSYGSLALVLLFGILRNISGFEWLAPI